MHFSFVPVLEVDNPFGYKAITAFTDEDLKEHLKSHLEGYQTGQFDDVIGLYGGFELSADGTTIPFHCCGIIGNIANWEKALECYGTDYQGVWIGHPGLLVRGDILEIDICEADDLDKIALDENGNPLKQIILKRRLLREQIRLTQKTMKEFENRVSRLLDEMGFEDAGMIADILVNENE